MTDDEERKHEGPRVVVRRRRRDQGTGVVFGVVLIAIGAFTLLERITHLSFSFVPLVIGIAFLAGWSRNKFRGFLIAGGVLTGLGAGSLAGSFSPAAYSGFLSLSGLAAGFILAGALSRRSGLLWEYIVAGGLLFSAFISNSVVAFSPAVAQIVFPASVIVIGALLLFRSSIGKRPWKWLMAISLLVAISMFNATGFELSPGFNSRPSHVVTSTRRVAVPVADTYVIQADSLDIVLSSADGHPALTLKAGGSDASESRRVARSASVDVERHDGSVSVVIRPKSLPLGDSLTVQLSVPPGSSIEARTKSGDILSDARDLMRLTVSSRSGDVSLDGSCQVCGFTTRSGDVSARLSAYSELNITTGSGDVAVTIGQDPQIDVVTGSGQIALEGFGTGALFEHRFHRTGSQGTMRLTTGSGDVSIRQLAKAPLSPSISPLPPAPGTTNTATATATAA
ncbi:MAG: DUF4097 family beta strand repeat-containing protein [Actinomycetota bacterium]|nr:DUF4097 family beta strand repeat-containing protein [Actinomycetota bacterium]